MTSNNLPPVRHLPHWTRVENLRRPCSPRPLPAKYPPPRPLPLSLPALPPETRGTGATAAVTRTQTDPRVASVQKNIQFLQQQHAETLGKLHAEIDYLRRENKELQYRLIMEDPTSSRKRQPPCRAHSGVYQEEPLGDKKSLQDQALSISKEDEPVRSPRLNRDAKLKTGLITSLQPLRIHCGASHPPRAPTLQECEVIIRQLYHANSLQSQEIIRIKTLLRDIVLSRKITTEHYIRTNAYLVDGFKQSFEENKFPKLGLRSFPDKLSEPPLGSGIVLPALKPSLTSTIAERQRRTRAVQRDRFKRTMR